VCVLIAQTNPADDAPDTSRHWAGVFVLVLLADSLIGRSIDRFISGVTKSNIKIQYKYHVSARMGEKWIPVIRSELITSAA